MNGPKGSGHDACFTAGLSLAAYVNGILKEASCSYAGEYAPGYIIDSSGVPVVRTNSDFKIYKVSSTDNSNNNPDYANWYKMVPFGAPYDDINHNGIYDNGIDKPGLKNAATTLFGCLTDGFPENHMAAEGFGGGTLPMFCEMHFTAWAYNTPGLEDVQFMSWTLINKNSVSWDSTYMGIVSDPDLGYASDDYIGCDTLKNLGFVYNADNDDSGNQYSYGANPPAFGIDLLKGPINRNVTPSLNLGMTTFDYFTNSAPVICERDPNPDIVGAYNYLKGYKLDGTPWVSPVTLHATKFCYPNDPETNLDWSERRGSIQNCGGSLTGNYLPSNPAGDRRFIIGSGAINFKIMPNDTQTVVAAQMVARGTNNFNSVTKLKILDATVQNFYNFTIGVNNISSTVPVSFSLYQNYPNPFNPTTNIKFDIIRNGFVTLKIYDMSGKEVSVLINNEMVSAGTNEVSFDAANFASGIYFYTLTTGSFTNTKKMILLK
ncbi:hypothetical protein BH10BAC5_BH10BAC5_24250 [soil metagenome]